MKQKVKANPLTMFLVRDIGNLEHSAVTQYKFNRFWSAIWFVSLVSIPFIPKLYDYNIGTMLVLEVSLWANFATHFSGMSSAIAGMNTTKTVDNVADTVDDVSDDVDDIQETLSHVFTPSDIM